jgi:hypothetical protein
MIEFVKKYGYNVYSQFGEDGIINECLERLKPFGIPSVCCEFGAADGHYCSNTANLSNTFKRILFEINPQEIKAGCNVEFCEITPLNVNEKIEFPLGLLSMDTDGYDYDIWEAYKGKPDIVIIEINSSLSPMVEHSSTEKGASYLSMLKLGITKGYFLLCRTGNMVFVLNEHRHLFPEIIGDGIANYCDYFSEMYR